MLLISVLVLLLAPGALPAKLKLSVSSRRNQTGHLLLRTELSHAAGPRDVLLEMERGGASCSETTHLVTVHVPLPPGYELFPSLGYYKSHTGPLTWRDAEATCARDGAHLLVLNSDAETAVVKEFFARGPGIVNATYIHMVHVGVHDRYEEGRWVTVTNGPLADTGYSRWTAGKPDGKAEQNCGLVRKDALLEDGPCKWNLAFICELDFW